MTSQESEYSSPEKEPTAGAASEEPPCELLDFLRKYAQEKPEIAALWCFGIGFVLGWKLKPW